MSEMDMKKTPLDIPTNWPRPWKEIGEGTLTVFGFQLLIWKRFNRHTKSRKPFNIYGFAKSPSYYRIWYGKKVLHFSL